MGSQATIPFSILVGANGGIASAQNVSAGKGFVFNIGGGTLVTFSTNNICLSQSPGGAGAMTLNGSLVANGIATISPAQQLRIISAGNDSGVTFTIVGFDKSGFALSEIVTGGNIATVVSVNEFAIVSSITISGASAAAVSVGLNGIAVLDVARRIRINCVGNDSARTYTINGYDRQNFFQSESITGGNAASVTSLKDFLKITSILIDSGGGTADVVNIGSTSGNNSGAASVLTGVASTEWYPMNYLTSPLTGFAVEVSSGASLTYIVEHTMTDIQKDIATKQAASVIVNSAFKNTAGTTVPKNTTSDGNYAAGTRAIRLTLTQWTSGTATLQIMPSISPIG